MDDLTPEKSFDEEVDETIRARGVQREDAISLVALRRGQAYGAGDLVCMQPLTLEQRRAIGLDLDPEQVIAESRARLGLKQSPEDPNLASREAASAVVSSRARRR